MGIIISAKEQFGGIQVGIVVELGCDDMTAFFCRGFQRFESTEGFVGCHTAAMAEGWLERQGSQGRIWVCPACSGKKGQT
jgi:hypothetical protein